MGQYINMKEKRMNNENKNHQGLQMKVIDYVDCHNVFVQFDDGTVIKTDWVSFSNGRTVNPNYKKYTGKDKRKTNRLGEKKTNNQGCLMEIIEYTNANDITVMFDDNPEHIVKSFYLHFKKGIISNPFIPSLYGVGIVGNERPCMNGKEKLKEYRTWRGMIERCYADRKVARNITYDDCSVDEYFHYYPNFFDWLTEQENYHVWKETPNFAIDKDIILKGNKIYAPDLCCLVPNNINNLIKPQPKKRGSCLIGVFKKDTKYVAQCWNGLLHKNIFLGNYNEEHDAFVAYKQYKENLIKETADLEYNKGIISKQCRDALYRYEVEETD